MSERTVKSLAALDDLLPRLKVLGTGANRDRLIEEAEALHRAVAAFHMEAIRFRMHNVERLLKAIGDEPGLHESFEAVRHELEAAGFHTRSHAAP